MARKLEERASRTVRYDIDGESETIRGWGRKSGISHESIRKRINLGWSLADAVGRPINRHEKVSVRKFEHDGESLKMSEWSARSGIPHNVLCNRISSGMTMTEALAKPYRKTGPRKKAA